MTDMTNQMTKTTDSSANVSTELQTPVDLPAKDLAPFINAVAERTEQEKRFKAAQALTADERAELMARYDEVVMKLPKASGCKFPTTWTAKHPKGLNAKILADMWTDLDDVTTIQQAYAGIYQACNVNTDLMALLDVLDAFGDEFLSDEEQQSLFSVTTNNATKQKVWPTFLEYSEHERHMILLQILADVTTHHVWAEYFDDEHRKLFEIDSKYPQVKFDEKASLPIPNKRTISSTPLDNAVFNKALTMGQQYDVFAGKSYNKQTKQYEDAYLTLALKNTDTQLVLSELDDQSRREFNLYATWYLNYGTAPLNVRTLYRWMYGVDTSHFNISKEQKESIFNGFKNLLSYIVDTNLVAERKLKRHDWKDNALSEYGHEPVTTKEKDRYVCQLVQGHIEGEEIVIEKLPLLTAYAQKIKQFTTVQERLLTPPRFRTRERGAQPKALAFAENMVITAYAHGHGKGKRNTTAKYNLTERLMEDYYYAVGTYATDENGQRPCKNTVRQRKKRDTEMLREIMIQYIWNGWIKDYYLADRDGNKIETRMTITAHKIVVVPNNEKPQKK